MTGFVVAIVGAESTGKTRLAGELQRALRADLRVAQVDETLRAFCVEHGRTPRRDEQRGIAQRQTERIAEAAATHDLVIADTTALMIAVYSDWVFGDTSLYPMAEAAHRACDFTLLTALDLPWVADGDIRDGPHVREPIDALVRASLSRSSADYAVVAGEGERRGAHALSAVRQAWDLQRSGGPDAAAAGRWHWVCDRCGDAACERHLLARSGER